MHFKWSGVTDMHTTALEGYLQAHKYDTLSSTSASERGLPTISSHHMYSSMNSKVCTDSTTYNDQQTHGASFMHSQGKRDAFEPGRRCEMEGFGRMRYYDLVGLRTSSSLSGSTVASKVHLCQEHRYGESEILEQMMA